MQGEEGRTNACQHCSKALWRSQTLSLFIPPSLSSVFFQERCLNDRRERFRCNAHKMFECVCSCTSLYAAVDVSFSLCDVLNTLFAFLVSVKASSQAFEVQMSDGAAVSIGYILTLYHISCASLENVSAINVISYYLFTNNIFVELVWVALSIK